jgi:Spy/CpxP family protein refolding chaperone
MRTLSAVLALALAAWVLPALRAADEAKRGQAEADEGQAEAMADLSLTEEQEAKLADIRKECRPKVEQAARELADTVKEEMTKIRETLTPEQREKLQTLREERRERRARGLAAEFAHLKELDLTEGEADQVAQVRREFRPKIEKALEGLRGILTEQQRKAREEALKAGKSRREVFAALNLTDDQKQKVEAVCRDVRTLVREELEKVRDVLSEEQRQKLADLREERRERVRDRMAHRISNLRELNLTEEQRTAIANIRKEYRPKIQEAGNKFRAAVREEVGMIAAALKG